MYAGIVFLPFLFFVRPLPTLPEVGILIFYASLIGLAGFGLLFAALKKVNASTASMMTYLEIVFATFYGVLFFKESLSWNVVLGAALIVGTVILLKKESPEVV